MAEQSRDDHQFARIQLREDVDKARLLIARYEEGLSFYRAEIEQHMFQLGVLEEKLR